MAESPPDDQRVALPLAASTERRTCARAGGQRHRRGRMGRGVPHQEVRRLESFRRSVHLGSLPSSCSLSLEFSVTLPLYHHCYRLTDAFCCAAFALYTPAVFVSLVHDLLISFGDGLGFGELFLSLPRRICVLTRRSSRRIYTQHRDFAHVSSIEKCPGEHRVRRYSHDARSGSRSGSPAAAKDVLRRRISHKVHHALRARSVQARQT